MKSLILFSLLLTILLSYVNCKKEVIKVETGAKEISGKKQAEILGLITGTASGLLKKKALKPTTTYLPVQPQKPKTTIKMLRVVQPVLVRVEPTKETEKVYYIKKEPQKKKKVNKIKLVPSFLKGMFKGKIIGKTIAKLHH